jgi:N,N'-diacetyllegionaminate synthase
MDEKVFIIAEAGINHNGSLKMAKKMIDLAADAEADAIKFQTFKTELLVTKNAGKAAYQKAHSDAEESQYQMLKKVELDIEAHRELIQHCLKKNIFFLSSPFDLESVNILDHLGLEILKLPSGEITNLPLLRKVGQLHKKVILSTGMADLGEIEDALDILERQGTERENITVLHCNTEYPTPMHDVNLRAMVTIADAFHVRVGYSDHTLGIEVPIAAVALGAKVIEKHFTLDRTLPAPDHKASLVPEELKAMVRVIRNIELALGTGMKRASTSELENLKVARKSIVAAVDIKKGEKLTERNMTIKRPATGISPMHWDKIVGMKAVMDFKADDVIKF